MPRLGYSERRWALVGDVHRDGNGPVLLGRFCWPDGNGDEMLTRTFRTRALARAARNALRSWKDIARVVPVVVSVQPDAAPPPEGGGR